MNVKKLFSRILAVLFLCIFALSASAGNCKNERYAVQHPEECPVDPPTDPPPPPPSETRVLEVTVYFGDGPFDPYDIDGCKSPTCVSTAFTVKGTVICSSQVCDFSRTNEDTDLELFPDIELGIPPSQFNLLALTSIRGTDIVPAYCFSTQDYDDEVYDEFGNYKNPFDPDSPPTGYTQYEKPGSTWGDINGFYLRSPVVSTTDAPGKWWAHVWAMSTDMNGVERQYRFNLGGECNTQVGRCPTLRESDDDGFDGEFENGTAGGVFGENTNPRGDGQTCRCTVSSKPSCPEHVDYPLPASWITIVDVTP